MFIGYFYFFIWDRLNSFVYLSIGLFCGFKFCFSSWIWILILKDERVTVKDFLHTVGWVAHCSGNFLLLCSFLQSHCYFLDHPSFRLPGPPRASSLAVPAWLIFPRQSSRAILKTVLRWWFPHYIKGWKHLLSLTQDHVYAKNLTSRPWLQWKKLTMEVCTSQTRAHCVLRHCLLSLIYPALPTLFLNLLHMWDPYQPPHLKDLIWRKRTTIRVTSKPLSIAEPERKKTCCKKFPVELWTQEPTATWQIPPPVKDEKNNCQQLF